MSLRCLEETLWGLSLTDLWTKLGEIFSSIMKKNICSTFIHQIQSLFLFVQFYDPLQKIVIPLHPSFICYFILAEQSNNIPRSPQVFKIPFCCNNRNVRAVLWVSMTCLHECVQRQREWWCRHQPREKNVWKWSDPTVFHRLPLSAWGLIQNLNRFLLKRLHFIKYC